jgi:hypothetical protein
MEDNMEGTKETKELLVGFLKLASLLAVVFKDGVQAADALVVIQKIQGDEALKQSLLEAYNGIDKIPAEVKDLSTAEAIELIAAALPEIAALVKAISQPKA